MAYIDQYNLSQDATFPHRVEMAMIIAALNVMSEAGTTPNHGLRQALASRVIVSPAPYVNQFVLAVVSNSTISATSLDSDIQFQVNAVWNAFIGVAT